MTLKLIDTDSLKILVIDLVNSSYRHGYYTNSLVNSARGEREKKEFDEKFRKFMTQINEKPTFTGTP